MINLYLVRKNTNTNLIEHDDIINFLESFFKTDITISNFYSKPDKAILK